MKFLNTPMGGTKIVFEAGEQVFFKNIWAPSLAPGINKKTGENIIISNILTDGELYTVKEVIPLNVHKVSDLFRYVISAPFKGQPIDLVVSEVYFKCHTKKG